MMESSEQLPDDVDVNHSEDSFPEEEKNVYLHTGNPGNLDNRSVWDFASSALLGSPTEHYIELNGQEKLNVSPENTKDNYDLATQSNVEVSERVSLTGVDPLVLSAPIFPAREAEEASDLVSEHDSKSRCSLIIANHDPTVVVIHTTSPTNAPNHKDGIIENSNAIDKENEPSFTTNDNEHNLNSDLPILFGHNNCLNKKEIFFNQDDDSELSLICSLDMMEKSDAVSSPRDDTSAIEHPRISYGITDYLVKNKDKSYNDTKATHESDDIEVRDSVGKKDTLYSSRTCTNVTKDSEDFNQNTSKQICDMELDGSADLFSNSWEIEDNYKLLKGSVEKHQTNVQQEVINRDLPVVFDKGKNHEETSLSKTNGEEDMMDWMDGMIVKKPEIVYLYKRKLKQHKAALANVSKHCEIEYVKEWCKESCKEDTLKTSPLYFGRTFPCPHCSFVGPSADAILYHFKYCPSLKPFACSAKPASNPNKYQFLRGDGACENVNTSCDATEHKRIRLDNSNKSPENSQDQPDTSTSLANTINDTKKNNGIIDKEKRIFGFAERDVVWIKRENDYRPALVWEINENETLFYVINSSDNVEPLKLETQSCKKLLHAFDDTYFTQKKLENSKKMPGTNQNYINAVRKAISYISCQKFSIDTDFDIKKYFNIVDYTKNDISNVEERKMKYSHKSPTFSQNKKDPPEKEIASTPCQENNIESDQPDSSTSLENTIDDTEKDDGIDDNGKGNCAVIYENLLLHTGKKNNVPCQEHSEEL